MIYPLRDENCDTGITFDLSRWKQARGKIKISSKPQFSVTLAAYSLRVENFLRMTPKRPLPVGISEGIFKTEVKKRVSRCLPFEGTKLFSKHPPKWLLPLGISEEKNNFLEPAHFELSRWLLFEGRKLFRKAPTKTTSPSGNK